MQCEMRASSPILTCFHPGWARKQQGSRLSPSIQGMRGVLATRRALQRGDSEPAAELRLQPASRGPAGQPAHPLKLEKLLFESRQPAQNLQQGGCPNMASEVSRLHGRGETKTRQQRRDLYRFTVATQLSRCAPKNDRSPARREKQWCGE